MFASFSLLLVPDPRGFKSSSQKDLFSPKSKSSGIERGERALRGVFGSSPLLPNQLRLLLINYDTSTFSSLCIGWHWIIETVLVDACKPITVSVVREKVWTYRIEWIHVP